MLKLSCIGF